MQAIGFCAIDAAAHLLVPFLQTPKLRGQHVAQCALAHESMRRLEATLTRGTHKVIVQLAYRDPAKNFWNFHRWAILRLYLEGVICDRGDNHLSIK